MSNWKVDPAHTVVSFTARHMMITRVRGIFPGVAGAITFDEADPASSHVEVSIPTATVDTGAEKRDQHLRSADFLDSAVHPEMTFRSTAIAPAAEGWAITGDLTIRGVTRPVVLEAAALGIVRGLDGRRHAGFEGRTRIRRSDWGLTWNVGLETGGWLVSDDVEIELEVAADEVAEAPAGEQLAGDGAADRAA